jgi:nicotinate phosphoribosyltransferase
VQAVRLDSGDLGALASEARRMLDEAGLESVKIFASSSLDEYRIQELVNSRAPIDAFGVGTRLAVMEDASHLDMAYKLVEYGGKGRLKLSAGKVLYPGRKQVFRQMENGRMVSDVIGRFDEDVPGEPLLQPLMKHGRPSVPVDLEATRRLFQGELERLPDHLRRLQPSPAPYSVTFSEGLQHDLDTIRSELVRGG